MVSTFINNYLNPSKYNFYDRSKEDFVKLISINEIFTDLGVTEKTYY